MPERKGLPGGRPGPTARASKSWAAEEGHFWIGVPPGGAPGHGRPAGAMSVAYRRPDTVLHPFPVVFVHGGNGQGLDFLFTPDGRPGWAQSLLADGYEVYVVDRPGFGRSPWSEPLGEIGYQPTAEDILALLGRIDPQRSQWPGKLHAGDEVLAQFMASVGPSYGDLASLHRAFRHCAESLLERTGPAVLVVHSMGAPFGWIAADACPSLVKGIVAVEPVGPPYARIPGERGALGHGLTAVPLGSSAAGRTHAAAADALCNLRAVPVLLVTGDDAGRYRQDGQVADFLRDAGVCVDHLFLPDIGIFGNSHFMFLEKNNMEIAAQLRLWIADRMAR